jgi:hypothetical protein
MQSCHINKQLVQKKSIDYTDTNYSNYTDSSDYTDYSNYSSKYQSGKIEKYPCKYVIKQGPRGPEGVSGFDDYDGCTGKKGEKGEKGRPGKDGKEFCFEDYAYELPIINDPSTYSSFLATKSIPMIDPYYTKGSVPSAFTLKGLAANIGNIIGPKIIDSDSFDADTSFGISYELVSGATKESFVSLLPDISMTSNEFPFLIISNENTFENLISFNTDDEGNIDLVYKVFNSNGSEIVNLSYRISENIKTYNENNPDNKIPTLDDINSIIFFSEDNISLSITNINITTTNSIVPYDVPDIRFTPNSETPVQIGLVLPQDLSNFKDLNLRYTINIQSDETKMLRLAFSSFDSA